MNRNIFLFRIVSFYLQQVEVAAAERDIECDNAVYIDACIL